MKEKIKTLKLGIAIRPILRNEMNSHCQVDLIDQRTILNGNYKFILVPTLQSNRVVEVPYHLLNFFITSFISIMVEEFLTKLSKLFALRSRMIKSYMRNLHVARVK